METVSNGLNAIYQQTFMGWGLKGIAYWTIKKEDLGKIGETSQNLLQNFHLSEGEIKGEVEAVRVRGIIRQAMRPVKRFFRAGVVVTSSLFLTSHLVSFLPIVPGVLRLFGLIAGAITWDFHSASREMNHAFSHFNRIHLNGIRNQPEGEVHNPTVSFKECVAIIDGYSQQIISNTWFISGSDTMERSLTSWTEHLTEQVRNQSEENLTSPWEIAARYFPVLPLVCRMAQVAEKVKRHGM